MTFGRRMGDNAGDSVEYLPGLSGAIAAGQMVRCWGTDVGKALVSSTGRHVVCSSGGLQVGH